MYLGRTLTIVGITYMAIHFASGYVICQNEFCPGDRENDWVYEYTDDDGKKFVVVEGKPIPKEQYKESK